MPEIVNCDKVLSRELRKAGRKIGLRAKRKIQKNVSGGILQRRSGKARKSIFLSVRKFRKSGMKMVLGAKTSVAFYLRFFERTGARAHSIPLDRNLPGGTFPIVKRRGRTSEFRITQALRINGKFVRKQVRHPGVRRRPFIQPVVDDELRRDLPEIADAMKEAALVCIPRTIQIRF